MTEIISATESTKPVRALELPHPAPIECSPLVMVAREAPSPGPQQVCVRVEACGVCRTDLHTIEGDIAPPRLPVVPGHQVLGSVEAVGAMVASVRPGDRVGVPWLGRTCGTCDFCRSGRENLCDRAEFTGFHFDGGYADVMVAPESAVYRLPPGLSGYGAAPLLCGGVIGYRALRLALVEPGTRVGLYGFGSSAHIALQVALHWGCEVFVFTRGSHHRRLAVQLGAAWAGRAEDVPPAELNSAVVFAPAGPLVHQALRTLRKGGVVSLAGIHMTEIPTLRYELLYGERCVRSVANSTRADVTELLALAEAIPVRTEVEVFPLAEAHTALTLLKRGELPASAVLVPEQHVTAP